MTNQILLRTPTPFDSVDIGVWPVFFRRLTTNRLDMQTSKFLATLCRILMFVSAMRLKSRLERQVLMYE